MRQGDVVKKMLQEEFTPYRLYWGAKHFLHDSVTGTCDWQCLPTADFDKNPLNYALKTYFWRELEKLRNES